LRRRTEKKKGAQRGKGGRRMSEKDRREKGQKNKVRKGVARGGGKEKM